MLIQYLSAKLGIVTDRYLPEVVRERFPRPVTWGMWVQAEIMAMSTDIAEFLGAALGLNLLFGVPLLPAGLMTGVIAFGEFVELRQRARVVFLASCTRRADHPRCAARHQLRVGLPGGRDHRRDVMPHVIYCIRAHQGVPTRRRGAARSTLIALGLAGSSTWRCSRSPPSCSTRPRCRG